MAAGQHYLGSGGAYAVAAISGTVNLDAITLSNAQIAETGRLDPDVAWRAILVAAISNLFFKLGAAAMLGPRRLAALMAAAFAVHVLCALGLILFWPSGVAVALPGAP
ncbi:MAG: DUF4010 domain-containing protein [Phycisphaerales bacterium]